MYWNPGEKEDLKNLVKTLRLGIRMACKQAKGQEITEADEKEIWAQIKANKNR